MAFSVITENFRNVWYNLKQLSKNLFLLNDFLLCLS
nr:MAG TPA: hypothetical protein [Caudoviricetes sp.]